MLESPLNRRLELPTLEARFCAELEQCLTAEPKHMAAVEALLDDVLPYLDIAKLAGPDPNLALEIRHSILTFNLKY